MKILKEQVIIMKNIKNKIDRYIESEGEMRGELMSGIRDFITTYGKTDGTKIKVDITQEASEFSYIPSVPAVTNRQTGEYSVSSIDSLFVNTSIETPEFYFTTMESDGSQSCLSLYTEDLYSLYNELYQIERDKYTLKYMVQIVDGVIKPMD